MHPNGYVREEAIPLLARQADDLSLAVLVVRISDWVPQVAALAERLIDEPPVRRSPASNVRVLPLLDTMSAEFSRSSAAASRLRTRFLAATPIGELRRALRDPDRHVRRSAARALVESESAHPVLADALDQDDLVTAVTITNALSADAFTSAERDALWQSKFTPLRELALYLMQRDEQTGAASSTAALTDRSPPVRLLAQRYLADRGRDVPSLYRALLLADPAPALQGLAEVGGRSDLNVVRPFLVHPQPRVQAIAVKAIGRLDGREFEPAVVELLSGASGHVARAVSEVLAKWGPTTATIDTLWRDVLTSASSGRRAAIFRVFRSCGRWTRLVLAFRAIGSADPDLDERARLLLVDTLMHWNRAATDPRSDEKSELRVRLPDVLTRLDAKTGDLLRISVTPYIDIPGAAFSG